MVVVDGARKMINKTIDINVTSVHQTTAGKMIFGRYDDRADQGIRNGGSAPVEAAAAVAGPRVVEGGRRASAAAVLSGAWPVVAEASSSQQFLT